ncbi:MAG: hypothetical protein Q8P67_11880 [archaeon]|nr:hypothetical protein [archaeon]
MNNSSWKHFDSDGRNLEKGRPLSLNRRKMRPLTAVPRFGFASPLIPQFESKLGNLFRSNVLDTNLTFSINSHLKEKNETNREERNG